MRHLSIRERSDVVYIKIYQYLLRVNFLLTLRPGMADIYPEDGSLRMPTKNPPKILLFLFFSAGGKTSDKSKERENVTP